LFSSYFCFQGGRGNNSSVSVAAPSNGAAARLLAELQHIKKASPEKSGYSVAPMKKNLVTHLSIWSCLFYPFCCVVFVGMQIEQV
jgi:hypothetical protein